MIEKMEEILNINRVRLPSLRGIDRRKLKISVQKVDAVLKKIETTDITSTNDLIYADAVIVNEIVGVKSSGKTTDKEPWWKRRLQKQVSELNKDLGRVNALMQEKKIKQKHKDELQRRYKIKKKGLGVVREEIKQIIIAKTGKVKRYSDRISQYQQNRMFQNNGKRFYQQLNSDEH